jgi:hypothetical protein
MSIEREGQKDGVSAEIAELESQFFGRPRPGRATEQLLWAYALGALSLEEEDKALALIAGDDEAQEALARIGRSLDTREGETATLAAARAAAPAPSLASRIWGATGEALRDVWAAFSLKPEQVVAVFLQKPGGLEVRALLGAEVALEPACLSRGPSLSRGEPEAAPRAAGRKRVRMPDGTEVSVVCELGGGFRLIVSLPSRSIQGLVQVRRLVLRDGKQLEEETGVQGRVKDGVATLKECPEGAVKLITPDGRALVLILGHE